MFPGIFAYGQNLQEKNHLKFEKATGEIANYSGDLNLEWKHKPLIEAGQVSDKRSVIWISGHRAYIIAKVSWVQKTSGTPSSEPCESTQLKTLSTCTRREVCTSCAYKCSTVHQRA